MKIENCEKCLFHSGATITKPTEEQKLHIRTCLHKDSQQTTIDLRDFVKGFPISCPLSDDCNFKIIKSKN